MGTILQRYASRTEICSPLVHLLLRYHLPHVSLPFGDNFQPVPALFAIKTILHAGIIHHTLHHTRHIGSTIEHHQMCTQKCQPIPLQRLNINCNLRNVPTDRNNFSFSMNTWSSLLNWSWYFQGFFSSMDVPLNEHRSNGWKYRLDSESTGKVDAL